MSKTTLLFIVLSISVHAQKVWTPGEANNWYKQQSWPVGCNFIPSTAINQLEMWQADTFDPSTIDRELGWAQNLGFNVVRVYLHNIAWETDGAGFVRRLGQFLTLTDKHKIKVVFVLFDDCWLPDPKPGKQPDPIPGVHNSGWVRSPGPAIVSDPGRWELLELYAKSVLALFKDDKRILMWDLYNEPGNSDMAAISFPLLEKVYQWAWSIRPSQPITSAIWNGDEKFKRYNEFQLANSDIITFHNYSDSKNLEGEILRLQKLGRPLICSEYMARTNNSTFQKNLPVMKKYNVGAINWGLVSGKSNTIFPWGSKKDSPEPALWFHDIFRKDGTPFSVAETTLIREITKRPNQN
jgi:Glycosyl hydrolases family 2, TIM barrel domain